MKFGSLFAGIGGLDLGLERAGMACAWQVEIDEYCRKVLTKHWPDVPKFGDIIECGAHNLEPVELICGGFPCQDISFAGKGAGIEGKRSGLWSEYHRIICELRPRYVLVENVSALLVRGIGRVLGDLAESGYNAEWDCIRDRDVGAPIKTEHVWIVAWATCVLGDGRKDHRQRRPGQVPKSGNRSAQAPWESGPWVPCKPGVLRGINGAPNRVDRLKGIGNAVVPQVAEYIGRLIMEAVPTQKGEEK